MRAAECPSCGRSVELGDHEREQKRALCPACDAPFDLTVEMLRKSRTEKELVLAQPACPPGVRRQVRKGEELLVVSPRKGIDGALRAMILAMAFFSLLVPGVMFKIILLTSMTGAYYLRHRAHQRIGLRGTKLRLRLSRRRTQFDLSDVERITLAEERHPPRLRLERKNGAPLVLLTGRDRPTLEYVRDWLETRRSST